MRRGVKFMNLKKNNEEMKRNQKIREVKGLERIF